MLKAKFIGVTFVAGKGEPKKHRWECPECRYHPKQPECRFNLSPKKKECNCRFCGIRLKLEEKPFLSIDNLVSNFISEPEVKKEVKENE